METKKEIHKYTSVIEPTHHQLHGVGDVTYIYDRDSLQLTIYAGKCVIKTILGNSAREIYRRIASLEHETDMYFQAVVSAVAIAWNRDFSFLCIDSRKEEIVEERQIVMWWLKHNSNHSDRATGEYCGGKDHATVIHAAKTVQNRMDTDVKYKQKVEYFLCAIEKELPENDCRKAPASIEDYNRKKQSVIDQLNSLSDRLSTGNVAHSKRSLKQLAFNVEILL